MSIVKSARGQSIDFDLMRLKQQMGSTPKPVSVQSREQFVDHRLRRRAKTSTIKLQEAISEIKEVEKTVGEEEDIAPSEEITKPAPKKTTRQKVQLNAEDAETPEE